jgi:hypothetical protein
MKSKALKLSFGWNSLKFRFPIKNILDAENVESYRKDVIFMILCLKLEFSVLFWPKNRIFPFRFSWVFNRVVQTRLEVEDDEFILINVVVIYII